MAGTKASFSSLIKSITSACVSPAIAFAVVIFAAGSVAGMALIASAEIGKASSGPVSHLFSQAKVPKPRILGESASAFYPYSSGSLVNDGGTIYFISGTSKAPFTNWGAFRGLGYSSRNVISGDLANYTLAVNRTISTANTAHPWGSWLIYKGTVYYVSRDGLIGVPSGEVFASNNGNWNLIVRANKYDINALNVNANLSPLTANDSRVLSIIANPAGTNTSPTDSFSVSPTSLSFTATQGGANPAGQSLTLTNNSSQTVSWNIAYDGNWLAPTALAGTNRPGVSFPEAFSVNTEGLAAGVYAGSISFTGNFTGSPIVVPVTLAVTANPSSITVSPTSLDFNLTQGSNPDPLDITITNASNVEATFSVGLIQPYCQADNQCLSTSYSGPVSVPGAGDKNLTITPQLTGLQAGSYDGSITLSGNFPTVSVPVTITVAALQPAGFSVSPTSLSFTATQGGSNPAGQSLTLTNNSSQTVNWNITYNGSWLIPTALAGTNRPGMSFPEAFSVNTAGLAAGTYAGSISFTGNFTGSPITVPVTLTVAAASGSPRVGQLVNINGTVYLVGQTGLYGFPDLATFNSWGFSFSQVVPANSAELALPQIGIVPMKNPACSDPLSQIAGTCGNIISGSGFSVSPTSLSFTATQGGSNPAGQSLTLTNNSSQTVNWNIAYNGSWLIPTALGGTNGPWVSFPRTFSVNTAGLAAGTYAGSISFTGNFTGSPIVVPVTLTVTAAPFVYVLTPPTITGPSSVIAGSSNLYTALAQGLDFNANPGYYINYTFDWGDGSPKDSKSAQVGYPVYHVWQNPGIYTVTVNVQDSNGRTSRNNLQVKASSSTPSSGFSVSPTSLSFTATAGGANPAGQSLTLTNNSSQTVSWNIAYDGSWLTPVALAGANGEEVSFPETFSVNTAGLAAGTYAGSISFTGNFTGSPIVVPVTLTVSP